MTQEPFFELPDWRERCQAVCDTHKFGRFSKLKATRRAEVVAIARNVSGLTPAFRSKLITSIGRVVSRDE